MASRGTDLERCTPQGVPYSTLPHMVNADGQFLFCRTWEPTLEPGQKPRALLFYCHGLRRHVGMITPILAQPLTEHGILVFSHDSVSHGQSEGIRGDRQIDVDVLTRDVLQHVDIMAAKYPGTPVFLSGQCFGGIVAIRASLQSPEKFSGMLLLAPVIRSAIPRFVIPPAMLLAWLSPESSLNLYIPGTISARPETRRRFANNPFHIRERVTLGVYEQMHYCVENTREQLSNVECPFLVLHGEGDRIAYISGSHELYEQAKCQDKHIKTYPNCLHDLLLESPDDVKTVKQDIMDWLLPRVDRA